MKQQLIESFFEGLKDVSNKEKITSMILDGNKTIKFGIDPTGSELHVGHLLLLKKLELLQQLGNTVYIVLGDYTATIGDPSGRDTTRPNISTDTINSNCDKLISFLYKYSPIIYRNSNWFSKMSPLDFITLASQVNVNQMLKRPDFKNRHEQGISIQLHEFMYPLLQGYDSVYLDSDIEIGGSDQLFNIQMGSKLNTDKSQEYVTFNILEGIDNTFRKMSKSFDNHISLSLTPKEIYQKILNMPDTKISNFFWLSPNIKTETDNKKAKQLIAFELITFIYDSDISSTFQQELLQTKTVLSFDHATEHLIPKTENNSLFEIFEKIKLVTGLKVGQMVKQKQVKINGVVVDSFQFKIDTNCTYEIQVGKKSFHKIKFI